MHRRTPRELALETSREENKTKTRCSCRRLRLAELYKEGASFSSTEERERAQAAYEELQERKDQSPICPDAVRGRL